MQYMKDIEMQVSHKFRKKKQLHVNKSTRKIEAVASKYSVNRATSTLQPVQCSYTEVHTHTQSKTINLVNDKCKKNRGASQEAG